MKNLDKIDKLKGHTYLCGVLYGILSWLLFIICDAIDEYILDVGMGLNVFVFFGLPIAVFIQYIIHTLKQKPTWKKLLIWHLGIITSFCPIWGICQVGANRNPTPMWFPVYQAKRGFFIDLNGIEYLFYGFTVLFCFWVACIVFHTIYAIVRHVKNNKERLHED